MAKKKAEVAVMPSPQQVVYAPTIGNAELVNMLVEQRVQLLEREIEQLAKQHQIHEDCATEVIDAWFAKENARIQAHFETQVLAVVDGLSLLLKIGDFGVEIRTGSHGADYHFCRANENWHSGDQAAKDATVYRHRVHIFVTRDGERVENAEDYGQDDEDAVYIIQNTLDQLYLELEYNPADPELKEFYHLRQELILLSKRIKACTDEIQNRDRMEKQALAMFTSSVIKSSPELCATMQALAAGINNGQLLLGE